MKLRSLSLTNVRRFAGQTATIEEIGDGILQQQVNALSSGAYTVFGLWLIWRALRQSGSDKPVEIFYGLALAGVGVGSIAFHGPVPPGARLLHDLTIAAVLAVIAARNLGVLAKWGRKRVMGSALATIVVVGAVMALAPDLGNALTRSRANACEEDAQDDERWYGELTHIRSSVAESLAGDAAATRLAGCSKDP